MTELLGSDLSTKATRLRAHRDALNANLPTLQKNVADCLKEIDETDVIIEAVARLRVAQDHLVSFSANVSPALRALLGDDPVAPAPKSSDEVGDPAPGVETPIDPTSVDEPSVAAPEPVASEVTVPAERHEERAAVDPEPASEPRDNLSAGQRRVLAVLVANGKPDGICYMSGADVAEAARVSAGTLRVQIMPKLKGLGLAESRRHQGSWCFYVPGAVVQAAEVALPADPDVEAVAADEDEDAAPAAAEETAPVAPPKATSRMVEEGERVIHLLARAPLESDGSAMFMTSVVAKRMELTELRLDQVLDHLAQTGELERRSCGLKDHFRVAVQATEEEPV